jgi:diacylglycerol kinase family enzyme
VTRALLITNPAAARTDARVLQDVVDTLRTGGWITDVMATTCPGDAGQYATDARGGGRYDVVVAYGGDGTAIQIAAALLGSDIPLGLVPGGTGNLLASNLGLPRSPTAAARAMLEGTTRLVDVGVVDRPEGPRHFAVAAGTGFDAELMARTATAAKRRWKMGAYVARAIEMLPRVVSAKFRVTVDDVSHEVSAAMVLIANCGQIMPPFFQFRSDVRPDDGWLDVMALKADGPLDGVRALWELLRATRGAPVAPLPPALVRPDAEDRNGDALPRVWFGRGRAVRVETLTGGPRPVQLDGEPAGETPFEARLIAAALRVLAPPVTAVVPAGQPAV